MNRILPLFAFLIFLPSPANARKIVPPTCQVMIQEYQRSQGTAISCTRTREHQQQLIRKLCGRGVKTCAKASSKSNHLIGCACDFSSRHKPKGKGKWLSNNRGHKGNHMSHTGR